MAFDPTPKTIPAGRPLFLIATTTTKQTEDGPVVTTGTYVKIETASSQKPNNWSDFSQNCPEPSDQETVMVVAKDVVTEIDQVFIPKDTDGLMDNFGNVYMAFENPEG